MNLTGRVSKSRPATLTQTDRRSTVLFKGSYILGLSVICFKKRMWRLKQFIPKEQTGLEGKTVEVGSLKLQIRSTIAQGGFSCVYLARDAQSGKQYAVKHVICNDTESLDLVKKEVAVMKALRGHPNVVTLHSQSMYDMGRTKECFLVMEFCEKTMVNVLDSRGAGYFGEKQLLLMFRDICNAVYAMHSQSPPIAHRDLKAENVLLGIDGQWKLCDFGSTSTNHKRFEKADEMGIEEDIIRKHTTPAYRAPEMWDLYRRELISEKVDIWALGCLLYRIAYLKSAFDGESKLQILNGNYRLPDLPKYSVNVSDLINDMLNSSPEARPDVMQVWRRVNDSLPYECRKIGPDKSPSSLPSQPHTRDTHDARNPVQAKQSSVMPTRAPPPPPPGDSDHRSTPAMKETDHRSPQNVGKSAAPLGAFWSTHYAQEAQYDDDVCVKDKASISSSPPESLPQNPDLNGKQLDASPINEHHSAKVNFLTTSGVTNLMKKVHDSLHQSGSRAREDDETRLDDDAGHDKKDPSSSTGVPWKVLHEKDARPSTDEAFSAFVAEFQNATDFTVENKAAGGDSLQVELEKLRKELKQTQAEKTDVVSKYEKLTAICRSQRLEIQELKSALATVNNQSAASQLKETASQMLPIPSQCSQAQLMQQQRHSPSAIGWQSPEEKSDRQVGSVWDLQECLSLGSSQRSLVSGSQGWRAFGDTTGAPKQSSIIKESNQDSTSDFDSTRFGGPKFDSPKMGATNGNNKRQPHSRAASFAVGDAWGLHDSFGSFGSGFESTKGTGQSIQAEAAIGSTTARDGNSSKGESWSSHPASRTQPAGWAGF